jgi:hypothetical protein
MSERCRKYKNCVIFLEENEEGSYFGSIYFGAAQIDYTLNKKSPELVWEEAKELIDKLMIKK